MTYGYRDHASLYSAEEIEAAKDGFALLVARNVQIIIDYLTSRGQVRSLQRRGEIYMSLFPIPFRVKGFCGGKVLSGTVF